MILIVAHPLFAKLSVLQRENDFECHVGVTKRNFFAAFYYFSAVYLQKYKCEA